MPGVMITNGGPHSAEKWADMTGEHIFPIDANAMAADRLIQARKLQVAIIEALVPHHHGIQTVERGKLHVAGDAHLDTPYTPEDTAADALESVLKILDGSPWDKRGDETWQRVVLGELSTHFATSQNIERQWHCRRNQKSDVAKAWIEQHHPETPIPEAGA